MSIEDAGFKEVSNLDEIKETLDEIKKSWQGICEAFSVNPELKIQPSVIKSNLKMTLIELNELQNLEYVKNSNKALEKLHETYIKDMIKFAYTVLDNEESKVWKDEIEGYIKEIFTEDVLVDSGIEVKDDESITMEKLFEEINRVFSITSQLNVIKGMESGNFDESSFMGLESNFIYLGIGLVQACNGNAVIMGSVVTFLKVVIKISDNVLKAITGMLTK